MWNSPQAPIRHPTTSRAIALRNNQTDHHSRILPQSPKTPKPHNNHGLPHPLPASQQRSSRTPRQLLNRPNRRPAEPTLLPDLATNAAGRRTCAQACGRFQGNVSLSCTYIFSNLEKKRRVCSLQGRKKKPGSSEGTDGDCHWGTRKTMLLRGNKDLGNVVYGRDQLN